MTSMTTDADRVAELARRVVAEHDPNSVPIPEFLGACYDAGLSWVHFPEGLGGLALPRGLQAVADRILQGAGGPVPLGLNPMGYGMAAPTIREHAQTDELKRFWLRPLATTEDIWCQLFSEPGAGSDLAGLATSAVPDGDDWIVNGQKVWTSLAHRARWGVELQARVLVDGRDSRVTDQHGRDRPTTVRHHPSRTPGIGTGLRDSAAWCYARVALSQRSVPHRLGFETTTTPPIPPWCHADGGHVP